MLQMNFDTEEVRSLSTLRGSFKVQNQKPVPCNSQGTIFNVFFNVRRCHANRMLLK